MRRLAAALAVSVAPILTCGAAPSGVLPAAVVAAATKDVQQKNAGAISVAVVEDGRISAAGTIGNANPDTAFSVGSVSKMFTAVSIMLLAQRRRLSLDDMAGKYLPRYPVLDGISIRRLLDHTSGIPNYMDDAIANGDVTVKTTPAAILSANLDRPLDFAPGSDWNYSNTGYVVLGQIVERVSGLSLADFEKRNIFDPAGMRHTFSAPAFGAGIAQPFDGSPGDWSWYYAAGDLFSSADDLARFDVALMQGKLLRSDFFEEMQQTVPYPTFTPDMRDGLGVFVSDVGNIEIVGHHGGDPGFVADNEMVPARRFAVAGSETAVTTRRP